MIPVVTKQNSITWPIWSHTLYSLRGQAIAYSLPHVFHPGPGHRAVENCWFWGCVWNWAGGSPCIWKSMHSPYWLHQHFSNFKATVKDNQKKAISPLPQGNATLIRNKFNYDMPIKEFIPNDKIIYSFNMYKEFWDKASFRKDYLNKYFILKMAFLYGGKCMNSLWPLSFSSYGICFDDWGVFSIKLSFPFTLTSHLSTSFFCSGR